MIKAKHFTGPLAALVFFSCVMARSSELLPPGHRALPLGIHALTGARVIVKPGEVLDSATLILRDGFIEAVGADVEPPPDARVWDMEGMVVYAGLIDPYVSLGSVRPAGNDGDGQQMALTSGHIHFFGVPGGERDPGTPGPAYEIALITPERRVAQTFSPDAKTLEALREAGFTAANIIPERGILRGASAFATLGDAAPNRAVVRSDVFQHVVFSAEGGRDSAYPRSLMGVIAAIRQVMLDAQHYVRDHEHYREHPRGRQRPEFNVALDALVPAVERKMPVVFEPGSALMVPRAAQVARELELDFLLVASGQEWRRPDLVEPLGVPFIVPVDFPEIPRMPDEEDWNDISLDQLRTWDWAPENPALLRRLQLDIALTTHGLADRKNFRRNLQLAIDRGLSEDDALAALTIVPARLCGVDQLFGTIEPGKTANLTVVDGRSYFDSDARIHAVWIDGRHYPGPVKKPSKPRKDNDATEEESTEAEDEPQDAQEKSEEDTEEKKKKPDEKREPRKVLTARAPLEGRGPIEEPAAVLVRGATIWTSGPEGVLENAGLLVVDGKVRAVGSNLVAPEMDGLIEMDAEDWHVTPGLIDAHSHAMILGGVNEGSIPSSAMVRIQDVVNSETRNIFLQLAGGLTVANLLHGSANPIGGQSAVIKLRDGDGPDELLFEGAPPGIKFALGENVKQSNWGDRNTTRFPQTRMGVRTFMANRFIAARRYLNEWERYQSGGGSPPRRSLELETLGEILRGERWIHCHSYRQDEILVFLRLMEEFGITVGTLQHVLEGYKVADEIAEHGAGASAFSDWWAFKFEVYDAIPFAGSLMHERGVLVSFNSDSADLARRMHLEAAKAVKYGGTPEEAALEFVTINPARQLRIDKRVGSLEPGKDGDFVIWSKSPLDSGTVCLQTWIEGRKYFDLETAEERARALADERAELLEKAKRVLGVRPATEDTKDSEAARAAFFRRALEHAHTLVSECHDCEETP